MDKIQMPKGVARIMKTCSEPANFCTADVVGMQCKVFMQMMPKNNPFLKRESHVLIAKTPPTEKVRMDCTFFVLWWWVTLAFWTGVNGW